MADLILEDINGSNYLGLEEGETLKKHGAYTVGFPPDIPSANNPLDKTELTVAQALSFLSVNASICRILDPTMTVLTALVIAYHRLLAVVAGLISPHFRPDDYFTEYVEATTITVEQRNKTMADARAVAEVEVRNQLTPQIKADIRKTFTDRVCLVAFVFRARGHHWMNTIDDLFNRVWSKTRHAANTLHITWSQISRDALHAIYPVILDRFWTESVRQGHCNGALAKRVDVAPAGFAGPHVLMQGLTDLLMIAPGISNRVVDAVAYLRTLLAFANGHRYNGSVNARYYGALRGSVDEKRLGAIAATILAALENLTDNAPLGESPALKRIANNAPITGAVLGRAIGQISQRTEVVDTLLIAPIPVNNP